MTVNLKFIIVLIAMLVLAGVLVACYGKGPPDFTATSDVDANATPAAYPNANRQNNAGGDDEPLDENVMKLVNQIKTTYSNDQLCTNEDEARQLMRAEVMKLIRRGELEKRAIRKTAERSFKTIRAECG